MKSQLELDIYKGKKGGRRPGAGRKRINSPGVAHRKRERTSFRTPLHINFKYKISVKSKYCLKLLKRAILNARKQGLRVMHFSLQSNHVHLIVEAQNNETLTRGMRSLTVTLSKGLRKGRIQVERYHLHLLKSVRETKNAIKYVLFNEQRHSSRGVSTVDEFSSLLVCNEALRLIKEFATRSNVSIKVSKGGDFSELVRGESFYSNVHGRSLLRLLLTN